MKEIARRIWYEPSVAIGLLVSIALLVGALIQDASFDWDTILVILSPLLTGLGIRPLVKPTAKIEDENAEAARNKLTPA
jgi:hypothetical protein